MSTFSDWVAAVPFFNQKPSASTPASVPSTPVVTGAIAGLRAALSAVAPHVSAPDIDAWVVALTPPMTSSGITTSRRVAAFVGQVAVETAYLTTLTENLNYSAERLVQVWPSHFDATEAAECAHNPERIANRAYASRMGNGDEASGDGWRFRGGGGVQTTGRENYTKLATAMKMTPEACADWCRTKAGAATSACWYWTSRNCNASADIWAVTQCSMKINGGTNGLPDRIAASNRALNAMAAQ